MNTPKLLAHTSLAAGVVFTATAEYSLARKMGAMEAVAVMLPVAIDAYAVAALKRFRSFDITLSLLLMGAAQVSAHLLDSHVMKVNGWLVVIVSLLVPVAIWRTHALARDDDQAPAEGNLVDVIHEVPTATVERVPEAYPAIEAPVPAVPEAVPAGVRLLPIVARLDHVPAVAEKVPVLAAEEPRTRSEVRAEYVPDDQEPDDNPKYATDYGLGLAAEQFKDHLLAGNIPSIRAIKDRLSVGQNRAKELQDGFREAQVAWRLAGSGVTP